MVVVCPDVAEVEVEAVVEVVEVVEMVEALVPVVGTLLSVVVIFCSLVLLVGFIGRGSVESKTAYVEMK